MQSKIFQDNDLLKELLINQDEDLNNILLDFVQSAIGASLKDKNDIGGIKIKEILDIESEELENALKNKLTEIKNANPELSLSQAYEKLVADQSSWWQKFLNLLSRLLFLEVQKPLIDQISEKLQDSYKIFLKDAISREKHTILQDIKDFSAVEEKDADLGKAVHEVKKYEKNGKLFFIKDVLHGLKGKIYTFFTGIDNEGTREVIGSTFYNKMGLEAAEVGLIKNDDNQAVKIFSKQVGNQEDKICTLGQLLAGWDFENEKLDETQKITNPQEWLSKEENNDLKRQIIQSHALSFIIGNRDLKNDNIMIAKSSNGKLRAIPIDFSLSCNKMTSLRVIRPFIHFNTGNMRHGDSLALFTQDEYKDTLKAVTNEYKSKEQEILQDLRLKCEALKDVCFQSNQYRVLVQNIQSNAKEAEKFCGIAAGPQI